MIREKKLKIRVLLVDDHPLVLEGVRSSLLKHDRFEIVGEASSGPEAIHRARESSPDVVVMDFTMPGMNGLEATTCLRSVCPETKVLILTVHEKAEFVREMIHSGARGYIRKSTSPAEFISAIECVHRIRAAFAGHLNRPCLAFRESLGIQRRDFLNRHGAAVDARAILHWPEQPTVV